MRVCLVTPRFPPDVGGVAQASARRAQHIAQQGSVQVLTPAHFPQTFSESQALFAQSPWDLIHGYYPSLTGPWVQQLAQVSQRPYVLSARGNDLDRDIWKPELRPALLAALQGAAALTGVSRDLTRKLQALAPEVPAFYVPNSVDHQRFCPPSPEVRRQTRSAWQLPEQAFCLGFVGELRTKKGLSLLLMAFARVKAKSPALHLILVGPIREGEDQTLFALWQKQHPQAAEHVRHIPHLSHEQLATFYPTLDLLVMPSFQEGMANAALEAMSCGVPVLATDVGGFPDLLGSAASPVGGMLIPPYRGEALESALQEILQHPDVLGPWGSQARQRVLDHFCHRHEQHHYQQVYDFILRG